MKTRTVIKNGWNRFNFAHVSGYLRIVTFVYLYRNIANSKLNTINVPGAWLIYALHKTKVQKRKSKSLDKTLERYVEFDYNTEYQDVFSTDILNITYIQDHKLSLNNVGE